MLLWFLAIGILGLRWIVTEPAILEAIRPHRALIYLVHAPPAIAFAVLGAVFVAVTGGRRCVRIWGISDACPSGSAGLA